MAERFRQIPQMFLEFWNKYTSKQKTIIISVIAAVIFTLAVLIAIFSRTQYQQLESYETTKEAAEAMTVLQENNINVKASGNDATVINVDKKQYYDAKLILGQNNLTSSSKQDYSDFLFNNSMSTTNYEMRLKARIQAQNDLQSMIKNIDGVKNCNVIIYVPDSSNSIYKEEKMSTVSISLMTDDNFQYDAGMLAEVAANTVGTTTDNVRIIDQAGQLLWSAEKESTSGNAKNTLEIKNQVENNFNESVAKLFLKSGYNDAQVASNLDIDLDDKVIHDVAYYSNRDGETGPLDEVYTYQAENVEGIEGLVGTDANGENVTDVNLQNTNQGEATVAVERKQYSTSFTETTTTTKVGDINLANSSMAIALQRYRVYNEEDLEGSETLGDMSYDEYKAANSDPVMTDVDENLLNLVANATGIAAERISVVAFDVPIYNDKPESGFNLETIVQIILALLIVGLIIFVVFKGMKPVEVVEMEPELSVEQLLATTKENQTLDDIEFSEKSATRTQIEKFVDENPEAVAALLRNWLNDDWD